MRYILIIGWIFLLTFNHVFAQGGYEQLRSDQVRTINGKKFFVHQVKKGQTLYSISKAYHIPMQEIIDTNPEIKQGLKANQTLLIPVPETEKPQEIRTLPEQVEIKPPVPAENKTPVPDPDEISSESISRHLPCGEKPDSKIEVYNVALMIHLFLKESDSISTEGPSQKEIESYNSLKYIQFYEGFLLAADSLRKTGLNLNLYVYSVETNPAATAAILKNPEMKEMDLIIGMLFNRNFEIVASWARDHKIPVVSPVSERESQIEGNPMVIKIHPSYSSEGIDLAEYLNNHHRNSHILLVRSWEEEAKKISDEIYASCKAMEMDFEIISQDVLATSLTRGLENIIVVVSNQKSFVLTVLSHLNADTMGYNFTVFGLPRWDQFEGLDYQYLEQTQAHILVPSWIDYNNPGVKRVVRLFRETYKTEPENLAFQGYDVAWYFLSALKQYGAGFMDCLGEISVKPLQTRYKFHKEDGNGWENHYWEILRYSNYSMTPLN